MRLIRWFRRFIPRLQEQLNIYTGIAGVSALILAFAALVASGTARTVLIVLGAAIFAPTVVASVVKAWPPRPRTARELEGKELPLADLGSIEPPIPTVGIIGVRAVGKTTLKSRLLVTVAPQDYQRTQRVTMHVSALVHNPTAYMALLDGRGESFAQQFEIADSTSILFVLLDHNDIPESAHPNEDRLKEHTEYGNQLRDYLVNTSKRRGPIHLLLNKKDVWGTASPKDQAMLRRFFRREEASWQTAFGNEVTSAEHSNDSPDDIAVLTGVITTMWQAWSETRA